MWLVSTLLVAILLIPTPSDSATIAHWKFEEGTPGTVATGTATILDSSGNDLNGTPIGGPIYRSNGMEFDGVDDRIHIPDRDFFELTGSFTLEAFINMPAVLNHYSMIVWRCDQRPGYDPYYLGVDTNNNRLLFLVQDDLNNSALLYSPPFPLNQYIHVAATLNDATGAMKIFINGNEVASMVTGVRPLANLDPTADPGVGIGGNGGLVSPGFEFGGIIDEVRISDVALDPSLFLFDNVAPTVTSTSPQDQAIGVAVNSAIAVTFSELMDTTSITSSTFTVSDGISDIVGNISFSTVADHTVTTFTPNTNLSYSTTYTATVTMVVEDLAGNPMSSNHTWMFTTEAEPATSTSGGGGGGGCSVAPGRRANEQSPIVMILVLTLPVFILLLRRKSI